MAATQSFAGRVLVTGANGSLGRALVQQLAAAGASVRALVRSERAAATLRALAQPPELAIVDWSDAPGLARAAAGCDAAVHLVGVLKETPSAALRRRARRHRARARGGGDGRRAAPDRVPEHRRRRRELAQRVPRLEGARRGDPARSAARHHRTASADGARRRRPGDLGAARAGAQPRGSAGARRRVARAADRRARRSRRDRRRARAARARRPRARRRGPRVAAAPRPRRGAPPRCSATRRASSRFRSPSSAASPRWRNASPRAHRSPRAMLDVLEHDDRVDAKPACDALGITLTPLDETLRRVVESAGASATGDSA